MSLSGSSTAVQLSSAPQELDLVVSLAGIYHYILVPSKFSSLLCCGVARYAGGRGQQSFRGS